MLPGLFSIKEVGVFELDSVPRIEYQVNNPQ
jgi:hypothetical protein